MKIVERVQERRIRELVNVYGTQFGFAPRKGTTNALFVVKRMQEAHREKERK